MTTEWQNDVIVRLARIEREVSSHGTCLLGQSDRLDPNVIGGPVLVELRKLRDDIRTLADKIESHDARLAALELEP